MIKKSAKEYAIYLLSNRERSESEIRKKMKEKEFTLDEIDKIITWLKEKNFINDRRFTEMYIRSKITFGATGKYKIKQKLLLLGVNAEIIEEELDKIPTETDSNNAEELAQKWLVKNKETDRQKKYEKLGRHLVSKGFDYDTVKRVLDRFKI